MVLYDFVVVLLLVFAVVWLLVVAVVQGFGFRVEGSGFRV